MLDFLVTFACYTLAIFLIYDRVEAYLAIWTPLPDEEKTTKEDMVEEVIENLEEVIEDELRADKELERKRRVTRIRKRLLPADNPS